MKVRRNFTALPMVFSEKLVVSPQKIEVILHLISSKCLPILLYGLEILLLYKYQLNSLDFVINRFFMKLFKTTDMYTKEMFGFALPSVRIARRTVKFISKFNEGNCVFG